MNIIYEKTLKEIESEIGTYQRASDYYRSRIRNLERAKSAIINIMKDTENERQTNDTNS